MWKPSARDISSLNLISRWLGNIQVKRFLNIRRSGCKLNACGKRMCSSPTCYQSPLAWTPKAYTRSGQSERRRSACVNQNATLQLRQSGRLSCRTPKRPKANSDTSARHAYTRTSHATSRPRLYIKVFVPIIVSGQRAILPLGSTTSLLRCITLWLFIQNGSFFFMLSSLSAA